MMWPQWAFRTRYSPLTIDNEEDKCHARFEEKRPSSASPFLVKDIGQLSYVALVSIVVGFTILAGLAGFAIGSMAVQNQNPSKQEAGTAPQVPIGSIAQTFLYNKSFADPPSARAQPEPIWDSLMPKGLGYIKDDPIAGQDLSVISAFHQLHCLYTLRRAYYTDSLGDEDFDFGLNRTRHASHCFEYLRQSIMCSADSSIEPAEAQESLFLGWGFQRQCRDYGALKAWAEKYRAFGQQGFLAHDIQS